MTERGFGRLIVSAGFLVTFGSGCGTEDAGQLDNTSPPPERCTHSSECDPGFVCSATTCVPAPFVPGSEAISLELVPPASSPFVRIQKVNMRVADLVSNGSNVLFPAPTTYETRVLDAHDNLIAARVSLFGENPIPGREVTLSTQVSAQASPKTRFALNPGNYDVRITPLVLDYPAIEVRGFTVREQDGLAMKEFQLPSEYRSLRGEVTSSVRAETKLPGFVVRATGSVTGLVSTTAISDEDGRYEILLPESEDTQFWLEAIPSEQIPPVFGYRQLINVAPDSGRELRIPVEPVAPDRHGTVRLTVLGRSRTGLPVAVPNALVTITATVSRVREAPIHELVGSTGRNGAVRVALEADLTVELPVLQERYLVRVQPEGEDDFAPTAKVFDFTHAGQSFVLDEQVILEPRTRVSGRLILASGEPASGARLDMEPLAENTRGASVHADAAGVFSLWLDPGPYLLVASPVASPEEPRPTTVRTLEVPSGPGNQLGNIPLRDGVWVGGRVLGSPEGFPIAGVDVQGFVRAEGRTIRVARSQTDDDGFYRLALPLPNNDE